MQFGLILKLSLFLSFPQKPPLQVPAWYCLTGMRHASYSPPLLGVSQNGAICTGRAPLVSGDPFACCEQGDEGAERGGREPWMRPLITATLRHRTSSFERSVAPHGSFTWK